MSKHVVFGSLLAVLAACGGSVESAGSNDLVALPERPNAPGEYRPSSPAAPEEVAGGLGSPSALAMAGDRLLVTTRTATIRGERVSAGALYVADKRVGPALLLAVDRQGASFDVLTSDGESAFVGTSDGRVLRMPVSGGVEETLATLEAPAVALVARDGYVYFASKSGALGRVAKSGGTMEPIATITGNVRALEADGEAVYVAIGAAEETAAGILRVARDGTVRTLASGGEPCAMIREGRSLYWTTLGTDAAAKGEVLSLSLDGGNLKTVAAGGFRACALAADTDSLYFATHASNALPVRGGATGSHTGAGVGLMRASLAQGGEPVAVAQAARALSQPGAVAVDHTHVYWLTETAVLRLRK